MKIKIEYGSDQIAAFGFNGAARATCARAVHGCMVIKLKCSVLQKTGLRWWTTFVASRSVLLHML